MKRFSLETLLALALVLGTVSTGVFPSAAYAEEVGEQIVETRDALYGEFTDKDPLTEQTILEAVKERGGDVNDEILISQVGEETDIEVNELEMSLATASGEQIKNWSYDTTLAYRDIYEDLGDSTADTWQGWIDWYAGMGYTYTGYTEARIIGGDGATPSPYISYWMWLTKGGKQYWCLLYGGAGNYASRKNGWIKVGDANGNNMHWYYINGANYLIYAHGWLNCKISETNGNHSLRQAGWFYLNSSGQMQTGWHPDQSGKWYYFKMDETYHTDGSAIKVGESADGHGLVWEETTHETTYWSYLYHLKGVNIRTNVYLMDANGNYSFVPRTSFQSITPFVTSTYYYDSGYVNSQLNTGCYTLSYIDKTYTQVYLYNDDYTKYYIPDFTVYLARKNYSVHATKDRGIASVSGEGTYYHDARATLGATVKPGYEFVGWKNASGAVLSTNPTYALTVTGITDLEVTTKVIPYHIEIDYNGGTGDNPTDYNVESEDITFTPPTKPGYEFIGWTGSNGDEPQKDVTIPQGTIGDLNYKANWRPCYKILFDGNDSTSEGENYVVSIEEENFTWPENDRFAKEGFSFQGWSLHTDTRYDAIDGFDGAQKAGNSMVSGDFLDYCLATYPDSVAEEEGGYVVRVYAVWDAFPTIKAKDMSIAGAWLDTMTEEEIKQKLFEKVVGEDTEDGILSNNQEGLKGVIITDFDMDELKTFQDTGSVSITFHATDGAGNSAKKQVRLWVNSQKPVEGAYVNRARCINKKYYDAGKGYASDDLTGYKQGGLMPNDLWYTDEIFAKEIEEAFANLESENWVFSWKFTHAQVLETQAYIEEHGLGDSEEEGALMAYFNKYKDNITINKLPKRCNRGKHDVEEVTCTKAAYCKICGEVFGKPEHDYHREIGAKEAVCTDCGKIKE